jgi:hypothetical protein
VGPHRIPFRKDFEGDFFLSSKDPPWRAGAKKYPPLQTENLLDKNSFLEFP